MARYALCSVCGKATRIMRARQCTYCGAYVCRKHRKHGLCPTHLRVVPKKHADALLVQDNLSHWIDFFLIPVVFFALIGSFGLITPQGRIFGYVSLGTLVVSFGTIILVHKVTRKNMDKIYAKINEDTVVVPTPQICLFCGKVSPPGTASCPECGKSTFSVSEFSGEQRRPRPESPSMEPAYEQYYQPVSTPSPRPTAYQQPSRDLPPPPPPPPAAEQSQYSTLPPPPPLPTEERHYQKPLPPPTQETYTSNQDFNAILEEISEQNPDAKIEVTGFFDEATNSGFHICPSCGKKFTTTGSTSNCPYCNKPLYGTR